MAFPKTEVPTGVSQWGMGNENSPFPELAHFNMIVSFLRMRFMDKSNMCVSAKRLARETSKH